MERMDWRLKGDWIKNCNCAFGCPCDFNARPTEGSCNGLMGMRIEEGHFGDVRLDGLSFFTMVSFPGPLHEGNGSLQPIIDERADRRQREALIAILSGQHSDPGTLFQILSLIVTKTSEPVFAPIAFEFDFEGRRARVSAPGYLEAETKPILNPVTGAEHRIAVIMPEGFEHRRGEVASCRISSTGAIRFEVPLGHSSLARVEQTPSGLAA